MSRCRFLRRPATATLACLGGLLLCGTNGLAAEPEGVALNEATGAYTVHRTPTRSLEEVMKSFAQWRHQALADGTTVDYAVEGGILSVVCPGCATHRPSTIPLNAIDLDTLVAYEAGSWHIGIRSKDGTQNFFGVLRGELGPNRDPAKSTEDRGVALGALADLYDLAYLTQSAPAAPVTGKSAAADLPQSSLAALAARGDVDGVQAQLRSKGNSSEAARALETAYTVRARNQMIAGQVDAALETLASARQKFGKSAPLREREAHYVLVGDLYDRLRLAVKLNVADLQPLLRQIETLEPYDSRSIEQMLAGVLADRIADQRAAARGTVADDLLSCGRELFPAWQQLLPQGRAGALPQTGVIDTP